MKEDKLKTAYKALDKWVIGVRTGNWETYLDLLTEEYVFWIPGQNLSISAKELQRGGGAFPFTSPDQFERYGDTPSRICIGAQTVVFEFILRRGENHICSALSFDVLGEKIAGCREYYCVLSAFS